MYVVNVWHFYMSFTGIVDFIVEIFQYFRSFSSDEQSFSGLESCSAHIASKFDRFKLCLFFSLNIDQFHGLLFYPSFFIFPVSSSLVEMTESRTLFWPSWAT